MLTGLDAAVCHSRTKDVRWEAELPPIALAQEFSGEKRGRRVPGGKGMTATAGSLSVNRVLETERDSKCERSGLGQLQYALAVFEAEGETGGARRQNIQQDIPCRLDRIVPASFRDRRETEQRREDGECTNSLGVFDLWSFPGSGSLLIYRPSASRHSTAPKWVSPRKLYARLTVPTVWCRSTRPG